MLWFKVYSLARGYWALWVEGPKVETLHPRILEALKLVKTPEGVVTPSHQVP